MNPVEGLIVSPTRRGIRSDMAGAGHYHAPRYDRLHQGLDFLCEPGQNVICPIHKADIVRIAYPYADHSYSGVLLRNHRFDIFLFYMEPLDSAFNRLIHQGDVIGIAQDISQRYDNPHMQPHVHLQIDSADPALFLKEV